jgi:LPS export ABC transporter protein LptC
VSRAAAVLVLGWAVAAACGGPSRDVPGEVTEVADSADQLMMGVRLYLTNQGVRQAFLEADTAFVYEASGRTELKNVRLTFFGAATGDTASVLTSETGTYQQRTGAMEARGNCRVVTSDGARLASSILRYDQAKNQVSTDQPYTYTSSDRNVQGDGFVSDPTFSNITTQRVRGSAGRFTLPGQ